MKRNYFILFLILIFLTGIILSYYNQSETNNVKSFFEASMYISKNCNCCIEYSKYLSSFNIKVKINEVDDVTSLMKSYDIPETLSSCHIIFIEDYIVIGHVPIEAINKLLNEKPKIRGISLPGMPNGSPGMGGEKNEEFIIYSFDFNGNIRIFMRI